MMRLFIALSLPFSVRERLAGLSGGLPGAKWVSIENFHLTLRFIGDSDPSSLSDIDSALRQIQQDSFSLTLSDCGVFGSEKKPKALWVGVETNPSLMQLQQRIEHRLHRIGFPAETRKYTPHVTLARFKENPKSRIGHFIAGNSLFRSEPITVTGFSLFSSLLGRTGPVYQEEARYPLGQAPTLTMADESWDEDWDNESFDQNIAPMLASWNS